MEENSRDDSSIHSIRFPRPVYEVIKLAADQEGLSFANYVLDSVKIEKKPSG